MEINPDEAPKWVGLALAPLGGIARYIHEWRSTGGRFEVKVVAASAFVSAFVGIVAFFILPPAPWSSGAIACLGWIGGDAMKYFIKKTKP